MTQSQSPMEDGKVTINSGLNPKPRRPRFFSGKSSPVKTDVEGKKNEVVVVEESPGPKTDTPPQLSFFDLFRYSTKFELAIDAIGVLAAFAGGSAQPLMTLLFGRLTQDFVNFTQALAQARNGSPGAAEDILDAAAQFRAVAAKNASYLVYIGIALFLCTYIYMCIWVYTGEINAKRIRELYLKAILRQDITFFDRVGPGEVATRIQTDTHLVQQGISEKVAVVANLAGAFLSGYIIAYVRSWQLALALTTMLPVIVVAGGVMNKFVVQYKQLSLKYVAESGNIAEEVISTIRTAQAFGTQNVLANIYDGRIEEGLKIDIRATLAQGAGFGVFVFVIYSGYALTFSFGTTLINQGHANAGEVVNVFLAILIGSMSLVLLSPELQAINHARSAAAKLFETIARVPEIDSANPGGMSPETVEGRIELDNVCFRYPSRPTVEVVKGVSITLHAGKNIALVGASGSGKSTIVSLIERFYDPSGGSLKLDGHNLKDLNIKWLRSQIGLVSQEPTLFSTTVKDNIAHGLIGTKYEHISDEEKDVLIKEASVKANADGFISQLPLGYDTLVGERGLLLSGGQKQRVAIARAIVSNPRILLLDEATSALDTQSEGVVQDALDKASEGRTTITIAHRLSTIKDCDMIYVMGDGLVLESGTHVELLKKGAVYTRLVEAQKLREAELPDLDKKLETSLEGEILPHPKATEHNALTATVERENKQGTGQEDGEDYGMFYIFKRMIPLSRDQWSHYTIGAIFACITGMVYPAFGVVFAKGVSGFSLENHAERRQVGDRTALWLFIIAIISSIAITLQNRLFALAAANLTARLRSLSFKAVLRQDVSFFDDEKHSTGSLVSDLSSNPQKFDSLAGITLGTIVQTCSTIIAGSVLGLVFVWKIGLVAVASTPVLVGIGYIRVRIVVMKDQKNKKSHSASAQLACESAGAIRTVAALTREDDCLRVYSQSLEEPLRNSNRTAVWSNLLYAFSQGTSYFVIALVFWFGSRLVSHGEISLFHFFVGLISTVFSAIQAGSAFLFVPAVSSARAAGSDIIKLLDMEPAIDVDSSMGAVVDEKQIQGHIHLENVHFRYPSRPGVRVLGGLSLEAKPGTYIALVGASGSGKSTAIQLIERFYDPQSGGIYLDGKNISELNIQEYRKHLAVVSQEPTLYSGTIKFNILLGAIKPHEEVTQEEIEQACHDANILEFIRSLPNGFETEVGGKGSQLSGGQKQRIAIARALLRNPKVLLLDEATSALDSGSEKAVQEALDQAAKGRTTIAIAHRLSTIQNADRIYFIKNGSVSEEGTHEELLKQHGGYHEFVVLQDLGKG